MSEYAKVFSPDGTYLGKLENAKLQYKQPLAPLETAIITLPTDDPKNDLCQMGNEVELFDNGVRVELYRIKSAPDAIYTRGGTISYHCEHVLAYLMDTVIFRYFEVGGDGVYTADVMDEYLSRQTVVRWVRGTCAFSYQKQYSTENKTLLQGLLAIPKPFAEESLWTYDTTVRPFVLNLIEPETEPSCEMRYERNMLEIRKSVDVEQLVTRLYALGYGEGVNQLGIEDVNGGVPYLDADTIETWGVRESIHQDGTIENAETLKSVCEALLEEYKNPYITYKGKLIDLSKLTGEPFDTFARGKMGRINDQEHGILVNARVVEKSKKDVRGNPGEITVTFANRSRSVADTIAALASRLSIGELNAQGQTTILTGDYRDNASAAKPVTFKIPIPLELVRINKFTLDLALEAFRGYSQGAAAGGGSTITSQTGGGAAVTSESGGAQTPTSGLAGGSIFTASTIEDNRTTGSSSPSTGGPSTLFSGSGDGDLGTHYHSITHTHTVSGHTHSYVIPPHGHLMGNHAHTVTIAGHTHTVNVPAHSHSITIPNHTHANQPGIYEGPTAESAVVTVDGNTVPAEAFVDGEADLIQYLSKDANGKILRGIKHVIVITPQASAENTDGLSRVVASVFMQAFIRSQGGGDY